jgi:hypothetical protein
MPQKHKENCFCVASGVLECTETDESFLKISYEVEKHGSMVIITKLSNNGISFLL